MIVEKGRRVLCSFVTELIAFETEFSLRLEREQQVVCKFPDAVATIKRFASMIKAQQVRLSSYIKSLGLESDDGAIDTGFVFSSAATVSSSLRQISVALSYGAASYAMLYEMALLLYEPRIREFAPKHLEAYANAAVTVDLLLPSAVAWELSQDALHCSCVCPMCGLGACGCVDMGRQTLAAVLREATAAESTLPGLVLQVPKPESELARVGVGGGEQLLAVDGQEVRTRSELQAAIRKHALGEELRFLVQRASELPRELVCKHVSDYPET